MQSAKLKLSSRKSSRFVSLLYRILSSLKFWIILWSLMFIYFFIIDLLNLIFGEKLIPHVLLNSASLVKVSTILTCFFYASFFAPKDHILKCALLFTFLADIILLFDNNVAQNLHILSYQIYIQCLR